MHFYTLRVSSDSAQVKVIAFKEELPMHYPTFSALFKAEKQRLFLQERKYDLEDTIDQPSRNLLRSFAIHSACDDEGNVAMVKLLLLSKIDVNLISTSQYSEGESPLSVASSSDNEAALRLLIDQGANLHHVDMSGEFPLAKCVRRGFDKSCRNARYLLDAKADIDQENPTSTELTSPDQGHLPRRHMTALFYAVHAGSLKAAYLLIEQGASLMNSQGRTVFEYCFNERVRDKIREKVEAQQVAIRAIQGLLQEMVVLPSVINQLICSYLPASRSLAVALPEVPLVVKQESSVIFGGSP